MPRKLMHEEIKAVRPLPGDVTGLERFPVSLFAENIRSL